MYRARVIPVLLLHEGGVVKTVKFSNPRYIGDPINTVRIFNEKEVDELIILDVDASVQGRGPEIGLIEEIVGEAFMPISYGGGVSTIEQMHQLFRIGVEKVSLSSAVMENPELIRQASREFGKQAVVVTLDLKKQAHSGYSVTIYNATRFIPGDPLDIARRMQDYGAGEIILNFVDRDGMMQGYDLEYVKEITRRLSIPVIALGGAGRLEDLKNVIQAGASAAAAGSLFVYYGKHRAVLINYPRQSELEELLKETKSL